MVKSSSTSSICHSVPTNAEKDFPYEQYFIGKKDEEQRRTGYGQNCWTGAESLESYSGRFIRDTMHGLGEYRWRYRGPDGIFVTYEGHFFGNNMHGYGVMSYPDGRVFNGQFYNNVRWGPGVESQVCLREDVGLWKGTQLIRLTWKPSVPSVAIDLTTNVNGKLCVEANRVIMATNIKKIGEVNSALELLKQCGSDPLSATEKWTNLYPKHCTDLDSKLCHIEKFDREYYKREIRTLEEVNRNSLLEVDLDAHLQVQTSDESFADKNVYFAWNTDSTIVHMMKHCYKHEKQRKAFGIDLIGILSGPRHNFKPAGKHELDCRTLLMASYLGHITNVAQLVNESHVHPNVTDVQGNSAIMYATCGDQTDIIHFLVEAGGKVDEFNDACCTPLSMALLKYVCTVKDITPNSSVQAMFPPPASPAPPLPNQKILEWNINREVATAVSPGNLTRTESKINKPNSKLVSTKDIPKQRKKSEQVGVIEIHKPQSLESLTDDKRVYYNLSNEYNVRVNDMFLLPNPVTPIPYIFEVNDMIKDIDASEVEPKKVPDKNPKKGVSKTLKPSQDVLWQNTERDECSSMDSMQKLKVDTLSRTMLTILQLLADGANPRLVRCPQPALLIATVAGSSDLIRHLVHYGADVNEIYPEVRNPFTSDRANKVTAIHNYTALDVAISRNLCYESLNVIKSLLECGATTRHRLHISEPEARNPNEPETLGPTLFHAVLTKKIDSEAEEEIRREVLELLLKYRCDPLIQYRGRSALDIALSMNIDIFEIFIKCPRTNLNARINENNQTFLSKIFSVPFFKTIPLENKLQMTTNLLLFGADPLIECQVGDEKYKNLFIYAKKTLTDLENSQVKTSSPGKGGVDAKGKKPVASKKEDKLSTKSMGKLAVDDVGDYRQTLELATECARMLYIKWLQAKLAKELIDIVYKYNHRHWNVILREHKNKRAISIWLSAPRCLEIWDILKTTRRKIYNDKRALKLTLCIVQYYFRNPKQVSRNCYISAQEKDWVENDVNLLLYEHKIASNIAPEITLTRPYVTPETAARVNKKFDVCFECMLPFMEEKIICCFCKLIAFCTYECMRINVDRSNCHPCRDRLKDKYFPRFSENLETPVQDPILI